MNNSTLRGHFRYVQTNPKNDISFQVEKSLLIGVGLLILIIFEMQSSVEYWGCETLYPALCVNTVSFLDPCTLWD